MSRKNPGLFLDSCKGLYRRAVDKALDKIAAARLPEGAPPMATLWVEKLKQSKIITGVAYGQYPLTNFTRPLYGPKGLMGVSVQISSFSYLNGDSEVFPDGSPHLLECTLAHELSHAYRLIRGENFPNWVAEELWVSRIENQYRFARGIGQRKFYDKAGVMPIKQYPW